MTAAEIRAQAGKQSLFLSTPADVAIYGGAAGGGKTFALLMEGLRYYNVPNFTATIFRRSYPEITGQRGLWDESLSVYLRAGGKPTYGSLRWEWTNGANVQFSHMQNDQALAKYDGAQIGMIGFDQLEHFSERQFWYMFARNRSMSGVKPYVRATCNPDPNSFLVTGPSGWGSGLISWWINEEGYPIEERAGVIRWFIRGPEDALIWADSAEELTSQYPDKKPYSLTFIPATVYDNKILLDVNPEYLAALEALPLVERMRFLHGNWRIKEEAGNVFNRNWFKIVQEAPGGGIDGTGWDFAATVKSLDARDPDYTARVKMRKVDGKFYILDAWKDRISAGEIDHTLLTTTQRDRLISQGQGVSRFFIRWETEGGSSGKRVDVQQVRVLAGYDAAGVPITGDKLQRARGLAAQAGAGNVYLVAGPWNDTYMSELHNFPDLKHDDYLDASSVIFNEIAPMPEPEEERRLAEAATVQRQRMREIFSE